MNRKEQVKELEKDWQENPRWSDVKRPYSAEDVVRLRGSVQPECTYARRGAEKLWDLINGSSKKGYVNCMGAITAGQAMQQANAERQETRQEHETKQQSTNKNIKNTLLRVIPAKDMCA